MSSADPGASSLFTVEATGYTDDPKKGYSILATIALDALASISLCLLQEPRGNDAMTTAEMIRISTSFVSETAMNIARMGRLLRDVLFFSLADDRIAPKRRLSVVLESGGVSVVYRSRFLSRMKTRGIRRYPFEEGNYPTPESLASTVALAVSDLKVAGRR